MDDAISRQAVLKLLATMSPEEATTKAMLIQSVKQMDAVQPSGPDNLVKDSQGLAKDLVNDCISRKAAIDAIKDDKIDLTNPNVVAVFKATGDFEKVETQVMNCDRHIKILKDLPSAQPERRKGRWRKGVCECGYDWAKDAPISSVPNFCPQCGADMRQREE